MIEYRENSNLNWDRINEYAKLSFEEIDRLIAIAKEEGRREGEELNKKIKTYGKGFDF